MEKYKLAFKKSVSKDLRAIPDKDVARLLESFDALADEPRGHHAEKLTAQNRYRIRQGAHRILYEVDDDRRRVTVVKVGHRREVYRKKN